MSKIRDQELHESRCTHVVEELTQMLDVGWMTFHNKFESSAEGRVICEATTDWEYRQCCLTWNLHHVATMLGDELMSAAVHEIVHALNAPVWESLPTKEQVKVEKLNELATENMARAIIHLLKTT